MRSDSSSLLSLVPGAAVTATTRIVDAVASYAFYFVLARAVGVESFGLFALALTVVQLLAVACRLGLDQSALRFVARHYARGEYDQAWAVVRAVRRRVLAAGGAGLLLALGAVALLPLGPTYRAALSGPRTPLLLALPLIALTQVLIAALRGARKITAAALIEGALQPITALLFVVAAAWSRHETFAATGFLFAWAIAGAAAWRAVGTLAAGAGSDAAPPATADPELFAFGLTILAITAGGLFKDSIAVLALGHFRGAAEVGYFSAAQKTAQGLLLIHNSCVLSFATLVPEFLKEGGRESLAHLYRTITRWALMLTSPLSAVFIFFPEFVLGLFGRDFSERAGTTLVVLTLSQWALVAAGPAYQLLLMSGHGRLLIFNTAVSLLMTLALSLALIPRYGAAGAAAATLCVMIVFRFVLVAQVKWKLGVVPHDLRIFKVAAATAGCAAALYFLGQLCPAELAIAAAAAIYLAALFIFGFDDDDRAAWAILTRPFAAPFRAASPSR